MRKLVKAEVHTLGERRVGVFFYEVLLAPLRRQYLAAVKLAEGDELILDAASLSQLETLVAQTLPAAGLSRRLLGKES